MRRLQGLSALLLTAFFGVAGSFHQHDLPKPSHDHAGFCSVAAAIEPESCAVCKVTHTVVHLVAKATTNHSIDGASRFAVAAPCAPPNAGSSLLCEPRAPPAL